MSLIVEEQLSSDEIAYIAGRYTAESRKFNRGFRNGLILTLVTCVLICIAVLLIARLAPRQHTYAAGFIQEKPVDFSVLASLVIFGSIGLLLIVLAGFTIAYFLQINPLRRDLVNKRKVVETTHILEKKFMPHNQTYYFVIVSRYKYTVEVEAGDYEKYREGDEINLEYTKYARLDMGYY